MFKFVLTSLDGGAVFSKERTFPTRTSEAFCNFQLRLSDYPGDSSHAVYLPTLPTGVSIQAQTSLPTHLWAPLTSWLSTCTLTTGASTDQTAPTSGSGRTSCGIAPMLHAEQVMILWIDRRVIYLKSALRTPCSPGLVAARLKNTQLLSCIPEDIQS